ncbi:MAG: type III-A CRISPR-associated protein Cas10/Csm1 [Desulfonauticus sp.]|nr:type III-A CRISPR-associated protein Cas10/Csm1 [Desulfonauticus sp.]
MTNKEKVMNEKQIMVILAGLVHDIGKLAQRAKAEKSPEDDDLLPSFQGQYSHWHVLYTDYFVRNYLPLPKELEGRKEELALLASIHHKPHPERLDQMCVAIGDRLASGIDRIEYGISEDFRSARLNCIFEEVSLCKHEFDGSGQWRMKLLPFSPQKEVIFPETITEQEKRIKENQDIFVDEYRTLYAKFIEELQKMPSDLKFKHYLPWLLRIMEKYLWSVPSSSYHTLPDISLYDHLLITAAVAQALWCYHQENKDLVLGDKVDDTKKFILFGGDLSGIQKFIFGVSESGIKGSVRLFRARSFYLQALTRSVILDCCKELGLSLVCQIMDAGGKFILLLPNIQKTKETLKQLHNKIDRFFIEKFKGELALCLANIEVSGNDLLLENFAATLDRFNLCLDESKNKRFQTYLQESGSVLHADYHLYSQKGVCAACEKMPAQKNRDDKNLCLLCFEQIERIGKKLPTAEYVVFGQKGVSVFGDIKISLFKGPVNREEIQDAELILGFKSDTDFGRWWIAGYLPSITSEDLKIKDFFEQAKNVYPDEDANDLQGLSKTFSLIALKACAWEGDEKRGRELLCLLKADVDNLGLVFSLGLTKRLSLSRFASLSRMFNAFFAAYLVEKIQHTPKFADTYVVFAGGDDLFLIGPWHQTIDLALEIKKEFFEFCARNPDLSLSCGLYLIKPGFPVRRAAPLAEDALDEAKDRKDVLGFTIKNAVCVFDKVLAWEELERQIQIGKKLEQLALDANSNVTKGFIYRLLKYARQADDLCKKERENKTINWESGLYVSHAFYDIARNIIKIKEGSIENEEEVQFLSDLIQANKGAEAFSKNIVGIQYALCAIRR